MDWDIIDLLSKAFSKAIQKAFERQVVAMIEGVSRDTVDDIIDTWATELPGVVGLELELGKRAARLSAMLGAQVNTELARLGLTKGEYEILAVLRASGVPYRLRPSDLTNRLLLTSGGTSNLLRRLAAADLVEREADASDARSSWVRLSTEGVKLAEEAVRSASAAQARLLREVPGETVRAAIDALRNVLLALDDTPANL
jgi:DNA-binding MarR family transcriptional regulator